jgi:hypothetical protein
MTGQLHDPKKGTPMQRDTGSSLAAVPTFDRLQYFYGQLLGARDFQIEQAYFREKLKLHNRCLHGYGVVCGLEVAIVPQPEECPPAVQAEKPPNADKAADGEQSEYGEIWEYGESPPGGDMPPSCTKLPDVLVVQPGLALDCHGNELVVREPLCFEPRKLLDPAALRRLDANDGEVLYVSLCFHEQPVEPTRPAMSDPCGAIGACAFGKLRDAVRMRVSLGPPPGDDRCDTCCAACSDCCLLLARVGEGEVDNAVRRELGTHVPARISGVSWSHGASYSVGDAAQILGTAEGDDGFEIRFTRPVRAECLREPVVQILVTEGGRGRSGNVYAVAGEFVGVPGSGLVTSLRYRQRTGESLQANDLVTITFRAPMVLDACCRPVEGLNVGGRVPQLAGSPVPSRSTPSEVCVEAPFKPGSWTSCGQGNFESWFFISGSGKEQR